ncbi:MAG: DNA methyltransferase 1-associated protein 1 [Alyxoria varia]|nr:MAG: DNA methyltransferase 1-associated protein 1 [Alyxoria varia]
MSTRDVRDMLGLPAAEQSPFGSKPKASKKAKVPEKRPDGITREVYALMGERAPPIPLTKTTQFKAKRARTAGESVKWNWRPFINGARTDGLVLRHWRRMNDNQSAAQDGRDQQTTDPMQDEPKDELVPEQNYPFAKYNMKVKAPQFDDDQYKEHLKSKDWSMDETRYLMQLYEDFESSWPVIWDRYDFKPTQVDSHPPNGSGQANGTTASPNRTLEDLKARFYEVSAKVLTLHTPLSNMTAAEYENHDKMTKFNKEHETSRKKTKEQILHRTEEERREEEYLIAELSRIYHRQERFGEELKEVRERLDHSLTDERPGGNDYTTTAEIQALYQRVVAQYSNKNKQVMVAQQAQQQQHTAQQRRSLGGDSVGTAGSPTSATQGQAPALGHQKKGSVASTTYNPAQERQMAPRAQARNGITTGLERLHSGISFRADRMMKLRQAKSTTQTQKIAAVLAELEIPEVLQMPTTATCEAMEALVAKINLLLDVRKVREKELNEVKTTEERIEVEKRKLAGGAGNDDASKNEGDAHEAAGDSSSHAQNSTSQDQNGASTANEGDEDIDIPDAPDTGDDANDEDAAESVPGARRQSVGVNQNKDAGEASDPNEVDDTSALAERYEDAPDIQGLAPGTKGTRSRNKRSASVLSGESAASGKSGRSGRSVRSERKRESKRMKGGI